MKEPINWGIIGPGKIAEKFAADLGLSERDQLLGVASRDRERAKLFAEKHHAPKYYGSYEELARDPDIQVAYIATPHSLHFEHTMMCLENGKAVVVEKPMGMNALQVERMIDEARARGLFLMEALWTRFIPSTDKLIDLLGNKVIGDILFAHADFGFKAGRDPAERLYDKKLGGGSLLDIGIYPLYLSLLVLGMPENVKALARFTRTGVDSYCSILLDHENGEKTFLESTIEADTPTEAFIYGEKGVIKMHHRFHHTRKITVHVDGQEEEAIKIDYEGNGYYHEIREVSSCLLEGKTESSKHPLNMSLDLSRLLDRVRKEIGLTYEQDEEIQESNSSEH